MEFTSIEKAGRFLCRAYYNGGLKPSVLYSDRDIWRSVALCVERPMADENGRGGDLARVWRELMSGDLAKLHSSARGRVLGGRAFIEVDIGFDDKMILGSVDGRDVEGVREKEIMLYHRVGLEWMKLIESLL